MVFREVRESSMELLTRRHFRLRRSLVLVTRPAYWAAWVIPLRILIGASSSTFRLKKDLTRSSALSSSIFSTGRNWQIPTQPLIPFLLVEYQPSLTPQGLSNRA